MRKPLLAVLAVALLATSTSYAISLQISLGVREPTGTAAITDAEFAAGFLPRNPAGGIEWFSLDAQRLVLDGTWRQFTFDISAAGISVPSFTGDSLISADRGILEHIRIRSNGFTHSNHPITLWIDNIVHTYDPVGIPPPVTRVISTFANDVTNPGNPYPDGKEVMFQEPGFSGSTSGNLAPPPNFSGIDNGVGQDDLHSVRSELRFKDGADTRWVRLTTYYFATVPESNPILAEAGGPGGLYTSSTLTFWMRGIPEPGSLLLLGLPALALLRRR